MSDEPTSVSETDEEIDRKKEQMIKQLNQVVCICKGINLARILKGLEGSESVADVNRKVGSGSGGCQGERCGPKIRILLAKKRNRVERKPD